MSWNIPQSIPWGYYAPAIQQGWQCPVCGNVMAPWAYYCICNGKKPEYKLTTTETGNPPPTDGT